jgi:hypothetical protein
MDKYVRSILLVVAVIVLAAMLFSFGIQLYWMLSGPAVGAYGPMVGPMMRGAAGMHRFGGTGFGFIGPILWITLTGLLVAGIVALVRGGRRETSGQMESAEPKA